MICPDCNGSGVIVHGRFNWWPCEACGGCGEAHCCDGDQPSARDMAIEAQKRAMDDGNTTCD